MRKGLGNWIWWTWGGIPNWEARVVGWGDLVLLPWQRGAGHPVGWWFGDGVTELGGFSD